MQTATVGLKRGGQEVEVDLEGARGESKYHQKTLS